MGVVTPGAKGPHTPHVFLITIFWQSSRYTNSKIYNIPTNRDNFDKELKITKNKWIQFKHN